jgi:hypothetical protein
MIAKQYIAKRAILTPGGKVYGVGQVVPADELNSAGIPMLLQADHLTEIYKEFPDEDPAMNSPEDLGYKKKGKKK